MGFLSDNCTFKPLSKAILTSCSSFSCGNVDLDNFFTNKSIKYEEELLGKSYCFVLDDSPCVIVCAFTISNDSIDTYILPNSRSKKVKNPIPHEKHMRRYPSVLIGKLGVNIHYSNKGIGTELMNFIKSWFVSPSNKTGCRYIIVDAYNNDKMLNYYINNGFEFLFSTERQEIEYVYKNENEKLNTRFMYFDLIKCISNIL